MSSRWMRTVDETYWHELSEASQRSFLVQGGRMCTEERRTFQAHASWMRAVALRQRDDLSKQPGKPVPGLASFRTVVLDVLKA